MSMLTPGAIDRLRRVNVGLLRDAATIERPVVARGSGGANTGGTTYVVVDATDTTPVSCRMSPLGAGSPTEADQNAALDRWLVAFDLGGSPIGAGYRVTITGEDLLRQAYTRRVIILAEYSPRTHSAMRMYVAEDAGPGRK